MFATMWGMMKMWLIALCVLGGLCSAAEDAASLLCPVVKGEKKADQKKVTALAKSLKEIKKGIDVQDKAGQTALMLAAALDNRLAVAYLVAQGADAGIADKSGKGAADYAVSAPVRGLLSVCRESNKTILHEDKQKMLREMGLLDPATRIERVKLLVAGNKLKELVDVLRLGVELDAEGAPALHTIPAVTPEMLALLVRRGYDVNTAESGKVQLPADIGTAKLALALGMKPTEELAAAVLMNDVAAAKKLLAADSELAKSPCGPAWSPLCLAQSAEMVRALKAAGADLKAVAPGKEGEESLLSGIISRQVAGVREAEVVQALIEGGVEVGDAPRILHTLCADGYADARTAQCLISAGAKPEGTELHYAAARGKTALVKLLMENKMDPNAVDADGDTPLHFLIKNSARLTPSGAGVAECIKALIKGGANPKLKTKDGQNALQLAKSLGREDLAKIIKSAAK